MPISLPPFTASFPVAIDSGQRRSCRCARLWAADESRNENTWALLADTHIAADRAVTSRNVNMAEHLAKVVHELTELPELPEAFSSWAIVPIAAVRKMNPQRFRN